MGFAAAIVMSRGHVLDREVASVRAAGYSDAEIIEIVLTVALNTFTNYVNEVAQTDVDFPVVAAGRAAAVAVSVSCCSSRSCSSVPRAHCC